MRYLIITLSLCLLAGVCWAAPIHIAATFGMLDEVKAILAKDPTQLNAREEHGGETPLFLATRVDHGPPSVVAEYLLQQGANPNIPNRYGQTALHKLCSAQIMNQTNEAAQKVTMMMRALRMKQIETLLRYNADVLVRDQFDFTPLHNAVDIDSQVDPMREIIELLLTKTDVNVEGPLGRTPLHLASRNNNVELVKLLIEKGADVKAVDKRGMTPLHEASMPWLDEERKPLIDLLVSKGADVNARDALGYTPAFMTTTQEALDALLAHGADLHIKANDGTTVLHTAAANGGENRGEIVQFLLQRGLDPLAKNDKGRTPLFFAVARNWDANPSLNPAISLLLAKGDSLQAKDADGNTLLHAAAESRYDIAEAGVRYLLQNGLSPTAKNAAGWTPVNTARNARWNEDQLGLFSGKEPKATPRSF